MSKPWEKTFIVAFIVLLITFSILPVGPAEGYPQPGNGLPGIVDGGKINISVEASHSNELNANSIDRNNMIDVEASEGITYYAIVVITILVILTLIFWMVSYVEGADLNMAKFAGNLKIKIARILELLAGKLKTEDIVESETVEFIPTGSITSWDGATTLSGSGKYKPWSIEQENLVKIKKKDVMTINIKLPPPETEYKFEETEEVETFEWVTNQGSTEQIKVDKRTLSKISHPKIFICSLCDRTFVSIEPNARCPWCGGKAIFLQDM